MKEIDRLRKEIERRVKELQKIGEKYGSISRAYTLVKKEEYIDLINDSVGIDKRELRQLSEEQLRDIIDRAHDASQADSKGSPTFYDYLEQFALEELQ